jgi:integrase
VQLLGLGWNRIFTNGGTTNQLAMESGNDPWLWVGRCIVPSGSPIPRAAARQRGPRAARTIVHAYRVLHAVLQAAVRLDVLARNVADNVEPPKRGDREVEILKASDVPAVLDALKTSRLYAIVALALSSGARRSELLALRWCDVDLERAVIKIEHSLEQTKAGLRLKAPKTKRGQRSIKLPPFAVDVLSQHRKEQLELPPQPRLGTDPCRPRRGKGESSAWSQQANHHPLDLCA